MENKNKYLQILTLIGFALGSTFFNSYGQNAVTTNEETAKIIYDIKTYGSASLDAASSLGLRHSAKAEFSPSLIAKAKGEKDLVEHVCSDVGVKLGFEKKFQLQEKESKGVIEFAIDRENFKIGRIYLDVGNWSFGIKEHNFCKTAVLSTAKVFQYASWTKKLNPNFTLAFSIEEAKKFELYKEEDTTAIKDSNLKPRRDIPAGSGRLEYAFAEDFGCVELSGLVRPMGFHTESTGKTEHQMSYGVNLGGKFNFVPKVDQLTVNVVFGDGIGSYIDDLSKMSKTEESSVYRKRLNAEVKSIMSIGAYVSFEHRFTPAVCATISGGLTRILSIDDKADRPNAYLMGYYITPALKYWLTEQTGFGIEFSMGTRTNMNDTDMSANLLKASAEFKF